MTVLKSNYPIIWVLAVVNNRSYNILIVYTDVYFNYQIYNGFGTCTVANQTFEK